MVHSYLTVQGQSDSIYKEKGSRFLGFVFPVSSENDIKDALAGLKKTYFDARHHCFAWTLGADKSRFRASDDGEPNHSAGDPILGQIRSRNLTNVLVVVVRYFGGTKLGVGGLISAYKTSASDALNNARIIETEVSESITLIFPYSVTAEVMKLIKDFDLKIQDQDFSEGCMMNVEVKLKTKAELLQRIGFLQQALKIELEYSQKES